MRYIKNTTDFCIPEDTVVSLGKFDGIHKGHGRLLEYLNSKRKEGLKTVIFTFDIPPGWRVKRPQEGKLLTTNEEKRQLFEQYGIDCLIECPFTAEIMQMEPEAFARQIVGSLHIKSLVVGTDFRFGYNRRGDYHLLEKLSGQLGYDLKVVDKLKENGRDISSTFIREEILAGRLENANRLLGYHYFVQGTVVHGNEIGGAKLGIPTANLILPQEKLLPPFGVYLTKTCVYGETNAIYSGISNVGCKPTIEGDNPVGVETHLIGFREQIYGKPIKVEFLEKVRDEMKFGSLEELKRQMQKDIAYASFKI